MTRRVAFLAAVAACVCIAQTPAAEPVLSAITERLTARNLKADVSFLASDALQGRATPSPGLDIAAEFIASQFLRAGLEPAGNEGYFQTGQFAVSPASPPSMLTLNTGAEIVRPAAGTMAALQAVPIDATDLEAVVISQPDAEELDPERIRGKALILTTGRMPASLPSSQAALAIIVLNAARQVGGSPRLKDISAPEPGFPIVAIWDNAFKKAVQNKTSGLKVSIRIPADTAPPITLKNVIGVLPGSDPALKDTYILVTAHYDHLGVRPDGSGDRIFNGANDNASGVATLIEMAQALSGVNTRPKRSIVFIALFGEERGGLGSQYYARRPVFPMDKTVADINLEQMGRTDATDGPKRRQFNLTGFDFTSMAPVFVKAAEEAGVRAIKDGQRSDSYFARSDNAVFALAGVPSTTASVTYAFPDYHAVGDEYPKLDYDNMAKVDAALALAIFRIADDDAAPRWDTANPKTKPYADKRNRPR